MVAVATLVNPLQADPQPRHSRPNALPALSRFGNSDELKVKKLAPGNGAMARFGERRARLLDRPLSLQIAGSLLPFLNEEK